MTRPSPFSTKGKKATAANSTPSKSRASIGAKTPSKSTIASKTTTPRATKKYSPSTGTGTRPSF